MPEGEDRSAMAEMADAAAFQEYARGAIRSGRTRPAARVRRLESQPGRSSEIMPRHTNELTRATGCTTRASYLDSKKPRFVQNTLDR